MAQHRLITSQILGACGSKVKIFTHITVQRGRAGALFPAVPWEARCLPHCAFSRLQVPRDHYCLVAEGV